MATNVTMGDAKQNFYFRLDPSSLLSSREYYKLHELSKKSGEVDFINLSSDYGFEVFCPPRMAMKRIRTSKSGIKTLFFSVEGLSLASINLTKVFKSYIPNTKYIVEEETLLFIETGDVTKCVGIVPPGARKTLQTYYGEELPLAATHNLIRVVCQPAKNEGYLKYYLAAFFNSQYGKLLLKLASYGALQPHLHKDILSKVSVPIISSVAKTIAEKLQLALGCEIHAWKAYFKAMKVIEEYLPSTTLEKTTTSVASFKDFKNYGRLDSKFYLGLTMLEKVTRGNVIPANKLFNVVLGTAPRSREYKNRENGLPYISYESIDDSGYTDDSLFYRVPKSNSKAKAKRGSVIVTTVAHSIEGIGKVGILYPYDDVLAMTGLAILNPKSKDEKSEELCFYTFGVLKSSLMRKFLQSLTYGLTAQIAKPDVERIPIPIIDEIFSDVGKNMRTFIENIHKANKIKRETIKMLEAELNRALYGDKNDESRRKISG